MGALLPAVAPASAALRLVRAADAAGNRSTLTRRGRIRR